MDSSLGHSSSEDIDFAKAERRVFEIQRRIFRASKEGKRDEMHKHQRHLVRSFSARYLAVRLAAEKGKGRGTSGVDGRRNLSDTQKLVLAKGLKLSKKPDPVRRVAIPKPGSNETRPLGIPTIADRAHQHLIRMALEPEWEARFSGSMYGFRKGRNCHDALSNIRLSIQRGPKWVLDGDIEKFFDRLDHEATLKKLDTFPEMEESIRRILKAGMMEGEVFNSTELGTPQGGPLSPLIANIALCGMEDDLIEAFPPRRVINGEKVRKSPRIIIYADDFVILHETKDVIDESRIFITNWLAPMGLSLSMAKTKVCHTLEPAADRSRGFTFLGCDIRQHRVGKYRKKPYFKGIHTHIGPSKEAQKRIYQKCAGVIEATFRNKKRNAERAHREAGGAPTPQEVIIYGLNPMIRGWANYFSPHNSKRDFSTLDHKLFKKLLRWTRRNHPNTTQKWRVDTFFNGGNPWIFISRRKGSSPPTKASPKTVPPTT